MEQRITSLITAGEHRAALGFLAEAYSVKVARFCAGLVGSHAEGEELMQEAFIDAWRAMPRFRGESTARSWLFGIARRVCIRHLRQRDRRSALQVRYSQNGHGPKVARINGSQAAAGEDLGDHLAHRAMVGEALAALKPALREAVLLQYQAGLDGAELATALGVRPAAARKRVSLGLQALRVALRPALMAPPSPAAAAQGQGGEERATRPPGDPAIKIPGQEKTSNLTVVEGSATHGTGQEKDDEAHDLPTPASADLRRP